MRVTLKEVAALAGVSKSAVSRCYTEGASVSAKTRMKVQEAAKQLGYQPNVLASSLTTGRTKMIGLVSNNFSNPVFLEVFDLFTRGLQDRGLRPLLVNLSGKQDFDTALTLLQQYSVDGVVLASSTLPTSFAEQFRSNGIPVVHAFGRSSEVSDVNIVCVDNVECGRIAGRELLQRPYKKLAMLAGPEDATSTQDRLQGFKEVLNQAGIDPMISFASEYSFRAGFDEMQRLIRSGNVADGYFCGDDVISVGALSALQSTGIDVPNDVGLLGLNDMEISSWDNISLSTIHQPIAEIITHSVEVICDILDNPDRAPETKVFGCKFVERATLIKA